MAGEGFALEKFNQAGGGIPATERSVKGKNFKKRASFFSVGTNPPRRFPQRNVASAPDLTARMRR
jgi:hypothetical protein